MVNHTSRKDLSEHDAVQLKHLGEQVTIAADLVLELLVDHVLVGGALASVVHQETIDFLVFGLAEFFPDLHFLELHRLMNFVLLLLMILLLDIVLLLGDSLGLAQVDLIVQNLLVTLHYCGK